MSKIIDIPITKSDHCTQCTGIEREKGCCSVREYLPSMKRALSSNSALQRKGKKNEEGKWVGLKEGGGKEVKKVWDGESTDLKEQAGTRGLLT